LSITTQPALRGLGRVGLGRVRADGEQRDVPAGEVERVEILVFRVLSPKLTSVPSDLRDGERGDLVGGELALGEDVQHFAAHVARGADDDDR
jgi:hypothetical protein